MKSSLLPGLRGLAAGAIALLAVHGVDSRALEPACTLYVPKVADERVADWAKLGFKLVERGDFASLPAETRARLLDDTHYALIRDGGQDRMWLSTTKGRFEPGWTPVTFAAPKRGERPSDRYTCSSLRARLPFYVESRQAVADVYRLASGQTIGRTRGEAILDLERSFLVQSGFVKYERTNAKSEYLKLLARVKEMAATTPDFITLWWRVRRLVFTKAQMNIEYCKRNANMTSALVDRCVNCVGESYLLFALALDSGVKLPPGWRFGAQIFTDHLRAVAYDPATRRTYDMATGGIEAYRAAIFDVPTLYRSLWSGHRALRYPSEWASLTSHTPAYAYTALACAIPRREARFPLQAASFSAVATCDRFGDGSEPPERASNESKGNPTMLAAGSGANPSGRGVFDAARSGLARIRGLMGMTYARPPEFSKETAEGMKRFAENLPPGERAILLKAADRGYADDDFKNAFYDAALVEGLGFSHLLHRAPGTGGYIVPVYVEHVTNLTKYVTDESITLSVSAPQDTILRTCDRSSACLFTLNESFAGQIRAETSADRLLTLVSVYARNIERTQTEFLQLALVRENATRTLEGINAPRARQLLITLSQLIAFRFDLRDPEGNTSAGALEREPLRTAIWGRITGEVDLMPSAKRIWAIEKQVSAEPVAELKFIESRPFNAADDDGLFVFRALNQIDWRYQQMPNPLREPGRPAGSRDDLLEYLIRDLLTHPKYFFTVEPEPDEFVSIRPSFAMRLEDERVRDLKHRRRDWPAVAVRLPVLPGANCPPGATGTYGGRFATGIAIECGRADDGAPRPDDARDDQTGLRGGAATGRPSGPTSARDERTRAGLLRVATFGEDPDGDRVLNRPMSPEERRTQRADVTMMTRGTGHLTNATPDQPTDPRVEVYLKPETWVRLWGAVDYRPTDEPVIRILFHHAFRRKLEAPFAENADLARGLFLNFNDLLRPSVRLRYDGKEKFDPTLTGVQIDPATDFEGFGEKAFFRAALAEAQVPKRGWVLTLNKDLANYDISPARALIIEMINRDTWKTGLTVPAFTEDLSAELLDSAGAYVNQNGKSELPRALNMSDRKYCRDDHGRILGILKFTSGLFDSRRIDYYRLGAPVPPEAALAELVRFRESCKEK